MVTLRSTARSRRGVGLSAWIVTAVLAVAGCSSSGSSATSSAAITSAPSAQPTKASASPSPAPTSAPPVSPFESDPAVVVARAWAIQAAKAVNSSNLINATFDALMTPDLAKTMNNVIGTDLGTYYPGPVPFAPIAVTTTATTSHTFNACGVATGFAQNPTTHQPAKARTLVPLSFGAQLVNGTWLLSQIDTATFSCDGVAVPEPTW